MGLAAGIDKDTIFAFYWRRVCIVEHDILWFDIAVNEASADNSIKLQNELQAVKEKLSAFRPEILIGTAGTVTTLSALKNNNNETD